MIIDALDALRWNIKLAWRNWRCNNAEHVMHGRKANRVLGFHRDGWGEPCPPLKGPADFLEIPID